MQMQRDDEISIFNQSLISLRRHYPDQVMGIISAFLSAWNKINLHVPARHPAAKYISKIGASALISMMIKKKRNCIHFMK